MDWTYWTSISYWPVSIGVGLSIWSISDPGWVGLGRSNNMSVSIYTSSIIIYFLFSLGTIEDNQEDQVDRDELLKINCNFKVSQPYTQWAAETRCPVNCQYHNRRNHYRRWQVGRWLIALAHNLPSESPVCRDWPRCPAIIKETSFLLRKLYHKWRVSSGQTDRRF